MENKVSFISWNVRSSLKVLHRLSLIQGSQKGIEATKEKLPLKVENTVFYYVLLFLYWGQWTTEGFGKQTIFWIFWILYVWI